MTQNLKSNSHLGRSGEGRIQYIDAIRCFAILLVIEGHVRLLGMGLGSYDTKSSLMLYSFDLPLFFFISGFLAYKSSINASDVWHRIKSKFVLLVIPAVIFRTILNIFNNDGLLTPLMSGFGKYWFTITLFECFLLYYLISFVFRRELLRNLMLLVIAFITIALLSIYSEFGPKLLDFNHLCKYFYFFVIGLFAKGYYTFYNRLIKSELFKSATIVLFFVLLFIIDYQFWPSPVFHLLRDIVLRVLGVGFIVGMFVYYAPIFDKPGRVNKLVMEIGRKSLPIYLLQYFFIPDFSNFPEWIANLDTFTIHLVAILYTIFITALCLCFIHVMEQSSFVRKYVLGLR